MTKYLDIGDIHATPEELDDCRKLVDFACEVAQSERVEWIRLYGDLFHHHGIMHIEVLEFWRWALARLNTAVGRVSSPRVIVLVGNHDRSTDEGATGHALMAVSDLVTVVARGAPLFREGILHVAHHADHAAFLKDCQTHPDAKTLVCHQTFLGSTFDNGFYAKDGLDCNLVPQKTIISGHIHSPQEFGTVWYIGSPRWRTLSDANLDRAIWVVTHDETGALVGRKEFSTNQICQRIIALEETPEKLFEEREPNVKYHVTLRGPQDWIKQRRLAWPGARIKPVNTVTKAAKVRESEGIGTAFQKYMGCYKPKNGTSPEILAKMVSERIHV